MSGLRGVQEQPQRQGELVLSAPGKVILFGEHSVVHGCRGVATSVNLRTKLTLTCSDDTVTLDLPDINVRESWSTDSIRSLYHLLGLDGERQDKPDSIDIKSLTPVDSKIIREFLGISDDSKCQRSLAMLSFFHMYTNALLEVKGCTIQLSSEIPTGAGLGSSAAFASCLGGALLVLSGRITAHSLLSTADKIIRESALEMVNKWAYSSEVIMHGTPSGIDNTTCSFGGVNSFKNGIINSLGSCGLQIMLINTKVPRSTKAMVALVRQKLENFPQIINPILESMDALAEQGLKTLVHLSGTDEKHDSASTVSSSREELLEELGALISMNHSLLGALGVSHPTLEKVVQVSLLHGLHAKLTGAGGGGFAIALLPKHKEQESATLAMEALEELGCQVWMVELGVPGLSLHSDA